MVDIVIDALTILLVGRSAACEIDWTLKRQGHHEPVRKRDIEEAEQYITILEKFLKSIDSQPEGTPIGPDHRVRIPGITCPRCQQPVSVNYEGYEYLWIRQIHLPGSGIEPESYCSFPYYIAELIIKRHPDWRNRLVSACNRCHEELHFSTRHTCSKR